MINPTPRTETNHLRWAIRTPCAPIPPTQSVAKAIYPQGRASILPTPVNLIEKAVNAVRSKHRTERFSEDGSEHIL